MRFVEPVVAEVNGSGEESGGDGGLGAADPLPFIDSREIEEAMNGLEGRKRLGAKFKWRRSKFGFYCPVALKSGRTVAGRPEFAAAFLDKVVILLFKKKITHGDNYTFLWIFSLITLISKFSWYLKAISLTLLYKYI